MVAAAVVTAVVAAAVVTAAVAAATVVAVAVKAAAVMAAAERAGAEVVKRPQDRFYGGFAGYFRDPDGHLWEVAWNPAMLPEG